MNVFLWEGENTKFCELSENMCNVYTVFLRGPLPASFEFLPDGLFSRIVLNMVSWVIFNLVGSRGGLSNIFNMTCKILLLSFVFSLSGFWALFEGRISRFSLKDFFSRVILISICPIGRFFLNGLSSDVFLKCACVCMGRTGGKGWG